MLLRKLIVCMFLLALALPAAGASSGFAAPDRPAAAACRRKPKKVKRIKARRIRPSAIRCVGCERDRKGRIKRSPHARHEFIRTHPCPSTGRTRGRCPGYVLDHVVPLKRGGLDHPSNMQWQTVEQARAKDWIE